jgi:ribonucleoside-diphosphate reductase alpha chain
MAVADIAASIWDMKYRLKAQDGTPIDRTVDDTRRRIAKALAMPEADQALWEARFFAALEDWRFLPAGRVIAGAGAARNVTLFNCFVMGTIPDHMSGIFAHLREAALTMQQGGGIGYDFSTLRPKGAPVKGVGADASGPLSFMDVWDAMCRTVMSAGSRRGAMMATLRCDHPDIDAFIDAKREPGRLRMFNLSVLATDDFMAAVKMDAEWPLSFGGKVFKVVKAAELWDRIMRSTYDAAEPGVIFIDRINARNNLRYCEEIAATNPCGEEPLPPYGACLLGSINLAALVEKPFTTDAALDIGALQRLVPVAVRMMDNVVDVSRFPLAEQEAEARDKRRIGLGITGLADALILCGVCYGSALAVQLTSYWLATIEHAAYHTSADLAAEKGAFPLFDRDAYLAGQHVLGLSRDIQHAIETKGMRNSHLTAIAPTGTISLLAGNVSGGIEPAFDFHYTRKVLQPDGSKREEEVQDFAYGLYRRRHPDAPLPDYFVSAQDLVPRDHLAMQAAAQRHVDTAISKTINCPADIPFDEFAGIYRAAYDSGCKGCTTYRPNDITGSVLSVSTPSAAKPAAAPAQSNVVALAPLLARPDVLEGKTYKLKWPDSDHALYIGINDLLEGERRRPYEIFINSKNMEHYAWTVALTRMVSAIFRRGGDIGFVAEELKAVFDPRGGAWLGGKHVPSLLAAIGDIVEGHLSAVGALPAAAAASELKRASPFSTLEAARRGMGYAQCPKCGAAALRRIENCDRCTDCDYSRCG